LTKNDNAITIYNIIIYRFLMGRMDAIWLLLIQ